MKKKLIVIACLLAPGAWTYLMWSYAVLFSNKEIIFFAAVVGIVWLAIFVAKMPCSIWVLPVSYVWIPLPMLIYEASQPNYFLKYLSTFLLAIYAAILIVLSVIIAAVVTYRKNKAEKLRFAEREKSGSERGKDVIA